MSAWTASAFEKYEDGSWSDQLAFSEHPLLAGALGEIAAQLADQQTDEHRITIELVKTL